MPDPDVDSPLSGFGPHGAYMIVLGLERLHSSGGIGRKIPHCGCRNDRSRGRPHGRNQGLVDGYHRQKRGRERYDVKARPEEEKALDLNSLGPQWSIGKSVAEKGVPSYQLDGAAL